MELPCQRPDSATSPLHPGVPLHSVTGSHRSLPQPGGDAGGRPGTVRHSALRKRWVPTQLSKTQPGIVQSEPDLPFVGLTEPVLWLRLGHTFPRVTCTAVAGRGVLRMRHGDGCLWGSCASYTHCLFSPSSFLSGVGLLDSLTGLFVKTCGIDFYCICPSLNPN